MGLVELDRDAVSMEAEDGQDSGLGVGIAGGTRVVMVGSYSKSLGSTP